MKHKYKLVKSDSIQIGDTTLYRIQALRDFGNVKAGHRGGYIESESNLSQYGNCWVDVYCFVYGNAKVCGNTILGGYSVVFGNDKVSNSN